MFARCPHCGFLVALIVSRTEPTRCPQCQGTIEPGAARAVPSVDDATDVEAGTPTALVDAAVAPVQDVAHDDAADTLSPAATTVATPTTPNFARGNRLHSAPSFARRSLSMVEAGPRWPGVAVIVALLALLALQSLLAQRAELGTQAKWRPTLTALCTVLRCELPAWREPAAFAMLNRSVRPSPTHPGVLEITATFRNDARWPQPWPTLLLTLSDLDGQTVGARAFQPGDYRDGRVIGDTLEPGQSTTVMLDVIEPAPNVVAFTFDFH